MYFTVGSMCMFMYLCIYQGIIYFYIIKCLSMFICIQHIKKTHTTHTRVCTRACVFFYIFL